ncbi:hypothetical protein DFH27DRAFT_224274 [Peziza echinospora]|nr:hypothetical protein DFH27DRAFT_224274 [Peziza echinospora]
MNPIVLYCSLSQGSLKGREVVASQAIFFSLIYQLLCYKPVLHADLQKLISEDPSDESLDFSAHVPWTLLRTLLVAPGQGQTVFCCVDVQEDGDFTQRFLQDLYDLQIGCKLKILVTGTVTIKGRSEKSGPIYSINLDEHDFSNLTEAGICELIRKIPQYDDFRKDIERAVYFESNNPRLSVCLKLKYISSLFQVIPSMPSIIRQHLALLQCDQPALYRQILAGVAPNDHAWARKILSWILFSFRPLRCAELAVAISARSTNILEDISLDIEHDLHRVLGQLLDIETGDVRLIHPSLKTFFLTDAPKDDKWYSFKAPHEQHRIMSSDCLGYLMRFSRDDVGCYVELGQKGPFLNVAARDQDFVQLPFLEYAITNWHRHYQERFDHESALFDQDASIMDREEVIGFFNSPGLRDWCLNRRRLTTSKANASEADMSPECCALPLQHAAELGLIDVVQAYLDDHGHGESLPLKDLTKALDLASGQGHCKIVEMILKSMIEASKHTITANADIESEVEGLDSYTLGPAFAVALRNAAMKGYKEILDSVLQLSSSCATKLNGQDISSALTLAAARGRIYAVNKLLGEDLVDVNNTQEENGNQLSGALSWPPLYNAATHGHVDVISLLLSRGATLLALGPADQTSLHTASKNVLDKGELLNAFWKNTNFRIPTLIP